VPEERATVVSRRRATPPPPPIPGRISCWWARGRRPRGGALENFVFRLLALVALPENGKHCFGEHPRGAARRARDRPSACARDLAAPRGRSGRERATKARRRAGGPAKFEADAL